MTRILQAVIPVCARINLEYYLLFTDPSAFGCGTKLPHNITSLLGVMNGAASDLRPGLTVLALMLAPGTRHVPINVGHWVDLEAEHFHLTLKSEFDRLSTPLVIMTYVLWASPTRPWRSSAVCP